MFYSHLPPPVPFGSFVQHHHHRIDESENDKNERLQKWENFLVEDEDAKKEIASTKTPTAEEASGVDNEEIPEEQQPSENVESKIEAS